MWLILEENIPEVEEFIAPILASDALVYNPRIQWILSGNFKMFIDYLLFAMFQANQLLILVSQLELLVRFERSNNFKWSPIIVMPLVIQSVYL